MISVYSTCKDKAEALKISKTLLKERLAACINLFPVESVYLWKNKIKDEKEYAILIKTSKSFRKIKNRIKQLHSYKIPCIEKLSADFNRDYKKWVIETLKYRGD